MKIIDLKKKKSPLLSFEIFPPQPNYPLETIYQTLEGLKDLAPDFISVTYGAGGGNRQRTVEIASQVKNKYQIEVLAHLTCMGHLQEEIKKISRLLAEQGIENVLALRGDPPKEQPVKSDFTFARELIEYLQGRESFCIGGAAYPEGHPETPEKAKEMAYLKEKVEAGVDFLITQLAFDNRLIYDFLERLAGVGIICPVFIGVMPIYNTRQIRRITALCGATIPPQLNSLLEKYEDSPADAERVGIDFAVEQIADLWAHKVDGIHLYTMNKVRQTREILHRLKK